MHQQILELGQVPQLNINRTYQYVRILCAVYEQ